MSTLDPIKKLKKLKKQQLKQTQEAAGARACYCVAPMHAGALHSVLKGRLGFGRATRWLRFLQTVLEAQNAS